MTTLNGPVGILWPFALIFLMNKMGVSRAMAFNYTLAAIALSSLTFIPYYPLLGWLFAMGIGAFLGGATSGFYALCAEAYLRTPQCLYYRDRRSKDKPFFVPLRLRRDEQWFSSRFIFTYRLVYDIHASVSYHTVKIASIRPILIVVIDTRPVAMTTSCFRVSDVT